MIPAYFVLVFTCGYITCDPPKQIDFANKEACVTFVENFGNTKGTGFGVTCFSGTTGEKIVSSIKLKEEKK